MSNPSQVKVITGVSLLPWLKNAFGPDIVKKVLYVKTDEEEDDFEEENTMQLLERYASEDDEDD